MLIILPDRPEDLPELESELNAENHPFIFLIRDKATGNILFLGRFLDPESAEQ